LDTLLRRVEELREHVLAAPLAADLDSVHATHRDGLDNLARFVALRSHDLRTLQDDLAAHGLSSLGREIGRAHV
jgi:pyruvate kinase